MYQTYNFNICGIVASSAILFFFCTMVINLAFHCKFSLAHSSKCPFTFIGLKNWHHIKLDIEIAKVHI